MSSKNVAMSVGLQELLCLVVGLVFTLGVMAGPALAQEEMPTETEGTVEISDGEILHLFITLNEAEVQTSEMLAGERVPTGGQEELPPEQQREEEVPPQEDTTAQQTDPMETGQTQSWTQYFNQWDENGDGRISEDEFQSGFSELEVEVQTGEEQTKDWTQYFNQWDENGDGHLSEDEFQSGFSELDISGQMGERGQMGQTQRQTQTWTQYFNQWDEDGNGRISEDEFQSGFSELEVERQTEEEQTKDLNEYFEEWDENGDGRLSKDEFRSGVSELDISGQMGERGQMGEKQTPPRKETGEDVPPTQEEDMPPTQQQTQQPQTVQAGDDVQEFAQRMVDEHGQAIDRAEQLGNRIGVEPEENLASTVLQNSVQGLIDEMRGQGDVAPMGGDQPPETQTDTLEAQTQEDTLAREDQPPRTEEQEMGQRAPTGGMASDMETRYMTAQVSLHQQALLMLEHTLIPNTENEELRQMLEEERQTIEQHLEEAKNILSKKMEEGSSMQR